MVIYALTFNETLGNFIPFFLETYQCIDSSNNQLIVLCDGFSSGPPTGTSKGPQAAAIVADLSETTFKTLDGDIV